jgi:hypothetical protein
MALKTTFAGKSPWAGLVPKPKAAPKPIERPKMTPKKTSNQAKFPDPVSLEIVSDQPKKRVAPVSKYESIFANLKPGQAIKCEQRHAHAVCNAMRGWQKRRGLKWKTAMTLDYGDGYARVFRIA